MHLRFSFSLDKAKTARRYGLPVKEMLAPGFNIAPGEEINVITMANQNVLARMQWGLEMENTKPARPHYLINPGTLKINKFKNLLSSRRCIVPADGFYFWKKVSKKSLIPFRVSLKWNLPFAFGGIYNEWTDGRNNIARGVAIINNQPNDLLKGFIKKMPLILPLEKEKIWLDENTGLEEINDMMRPYPEEKMKFFPISSAINDPDFNSAILLEPVKYATDQEGSYILFT